MLSLVATDYYTIWRRDDGYIAMSFGVPTFINGGFVMLDETTDWATAVGLVAHYRGIYGNGPVDGSTVTTQL